MRTILNLLSFIAGIYILVFIVDWKEPETVDYFLITLYVLIAILATFNAVMYFKKKRA